jgi:uncharacterized membrane protein YgcG
MFAAMFLNGAPAFAQQERILSFDADIVVQTDGSIVVTETIRAVAAGIDIKRGIYRDFPTRYKSPYGLTETVGFEVLEVQRDGEPDSYHLEQLSNGVRVYIGQAEVMVSEGEHVWRLTYRTDRQLRHLENVDELYWNVTGNGWTFPMEKVTAHVRLPGSAQLVEAKGYTGYFGDSGSDYRLERDASGMPVFTTTRMLHPQEGLTIAVSWPKGFVPENKAPSPLAALLSNRGILAGLAGFIFVAGYFFYMWMRVGRDPKKGVIIPRFEVPRGLSPVALGYTANNGFGSSFSWMDAFAVSLTSLAIKGVVTLTERDDEMVVAKTGAASEKLPPGEKAVMSALFSQGSEAILGRSYDPDIGLAVKTLGSVAVKEYSNDYVRSNIGVWLPGALIAALAAIAALINGAAIRDDGIASVFLLIFPIAFGAVSIMLVREAVTSFRLAWGGRYRQIFKAFFLVWPALIFSTPVFGVTGLMLFMVPWPIMALVVILALMAFLFAFLLRAPTMQGRAMFDEIEGYKLYLSVAEQNRLAMTAQEPAMTVERSEKHLPYAMALGVADAWTKKFASRVNLTEPGATGDGMAYHPSWYHGRSNFMSPTSLTSHLSQSLSQTISSAATAPSSSSGSSFSSGGGSSGGGGGGGGGGGW